MAAYTAEEDALLVEYWPTHSCTEIAAILAERCGKKRSRCSIISRIHRKLMLHPKLNHRNKGHRPGKTPGPKPRMRQVEGVVAAKAGEVSIITLPWFPGAEDRGNIRYARVTQS